MIFLTV